MNVIDFERVKRAAVGAAMDEQNPGHRIVFAEDLGASLPPVPWIVEALEFAPGLPTMFGGFGYSAKSVGAQSACFSIAAGSLVWGRFPAKAERVVHLDYEQGLRLTQERYQRLARGLGCELPELGRNLGIWPLPELDMSQPKSLDTLARIVDGYGVALIDSYRASAPSLDENDSRSAALLYGYGRVSEMTGCAILAIHHAVKPSKDGSGDARAQLRGSGSIYGACQSVWQFTAAQGSVKVENSKARLTGRKFDPMELVVTDIPKGSDDRWGLRVSAGVRESPRARVLKQLTDLLTESPEGIGKRDIRDAIPGDNNLIDGCLEALVAERTVKLQRRTGRGRPGWLYVMAPREPDHFAETFER